MRILLVEDERCWPNGWCKALGQSGFRVTWIADGGLAQRDLADTTMTRWRSTLKLLGRSGHKVLQHLRSLDRWTGGFLS